MIKRIYDKYVRLLRILKDTFILMNNRMIIYH